MPILNGYLGKELPPALDHLRFLKLFVNWFGSFVGFLEGGSMQNITWLPQLVQLTPRLEHLSLKLSRHNIREPIESLSFFWKQAYMPQLKTVEFANGVADPENMQSFFRRHSKTLTEVTLDNFHSGHSSWSDFLTKMVEELIDSGVTVKLGWLAEYSKLWPLVIFDKVKCKKVCDVCVLMRQRDPAGSHRCDWNSKIFSSLDRDIDDQFSVVNLRDLGEATDDSPGAAEGDTDVDMDDTDDE